MKLLLIGVIRLYRALPRFLNRECLFKETCSSHVLRVTRESGFRAGVRSLKMRMLQCRPGYVVLFDGNTQQWTIHFANGSVAKRDELADFLLGPYLNFSVRTFEH